MYERTNELSGKYFLTLTYFGLNTPFYSIGLVVCLLDGCSTSFKICIDDSKGNSSQS